MRGSPSRNTRPEHTSPTSDLIMFPSFIKPCPALRPPSPQRCWVHTKQYPRHCPFNTATAVPPPSGLFPFSLLYLLLFSRLFPIVSLSFVSLLSHFVISFLPLVSPSFGLLPLAFFLWSPYFNLLSSSPPLFILPPFLSHFYFSSLAILSILLISFPLIFFFSPLKLLPSSSLFLFQFHTSSLSLASFLSLSHFPFDARYTRSKRDKLSFTDDAQAARRNTAGRTRVRAAKEPYSTPGHRPLRGGRKRKWQVKKTRRKRWQW